MVSISGKLFDIGQLESGIGIRVDVENSGNDLTVIGMSKPEVKLLASLLGEQVKITIELAA